MQYPGGAIVRVQGVGTVGQRYFVRDGALDGEASALVGLEIEYSAASTFHLKTTI